MTEPDPTIRLLREVFDFLAELGTKTAIAGAAAMACHGYVRHTEDIDYALVTGDPARLFRELKQRFAPPWSVDVYLPDSEDPLGGVATISGPGVHPIELVNFFNPAAPTRNPAKQAIDAAVPEPTLDNLPVVTPEYLIALKLYAGSLADLGDAQRLAEVVEDIDWALVARVADEFGLRQKLNMVTEALRLEN